MRPKTRSCCSPSCRPPDGKRKRLLPLLLAAALTLSGCGGGGGDDSLRIGFALYTQEDIYAPENQKLLFPIMSSSSR